MAAWGIWASNPTNAHQSVPARKGHAALDPVKRDIIVARLAAGVLVQQRILSKPLKAGLVHKSRRLCENSVSGGRCTQFGLGGAACRKMPAQLCFSRFQHCLLLLRSGVFTQSVPCPGQALLDRLSGNGRDSGQCHRDGDLLVYVRPALPSGLGSITGSPDVDIHGASCWADGRSSWLPPSRSALIIGVGARRIPRPPYRLQPNSEVTDNGRDGERERQ